jgi:dTDP-4-amino-4,6-dideoxygalactose transaminase
MNGFLTVWAPPRPGAFLARPASSLPYPLDEPGCRLYEWGRYGLWQGLAASGIGTGDEILVPAYHHGSEVAALADLDIGCRFYEATEDLEPDERELEALLGPRTRALYLIHHLGFGLDAARWRRWCDERDLLLIEDVAMAWLASRDGRPLGSWGDISFFSPWKTFGLPDCGAVICRDAATPAAAVRRDLALGVVAHGLLRWIAQRQGWIAKARRRPATSTWDPAVEFSIPNPNRGPSAMSLHLLRRSVGDDPAAARQAHHARLVERLGEHVPTPFREPRKGACPFGVPVRTSNKAGLLAHLLEHGISAIDFWSVPHPLLPVVEFPAAARRRGETVLLPVHQDLTSADVDRIGATVIEFTR